MPALALTDTNNLFGALEFSETGPGPHPADRRLHFVAELCPEAETQPENGS
jgi:hypothetical protein